MWGGGCVGFYGEKEGQVWGGLLKVELVEKKVGGLIYRMVVGVGW